MRRFGDDASLRVALRQIPEAFPFTSPNQSPGRCRPWPGRWGSDGARTWACHLFGGPRNIEKAAKLAVEEAGGAPRLRKSRERGGSEPPSPKAPSQVGEVA